MTSRLIVGGVLMLRGNCRWEEIQMNFSVFETVCVMNITPHVKNCVHAEPR